MARTEHIKDKRAATATSNKEEKEAKKPKKQSFGDNIAGTMEKFVAMREKQFAFETAHWASEKKDVQAGDFSIKRCISEMMTMALSTDEKAAAFDVFKDPDNSSLARKKVTNKRPLFGYGRQWRSCHKWSEGTSSEQQDTSKDKLKILPSV